MYSSENIPKQSEYVRAFEAIDLNDTERELLKEQFERPGRAITSYEVRDRFQYAGIGGANFLYGKLAKKVARKLNFKTYEPGERLRHWYRAIADGDDIRGHFTWIMRPQVASALVKLGVVDPSRDGKTVLPDPDIHSGRSDVSEGSKKLVEHLRRERNRIIVEAKKAATHPWQCEICGFDFKVAYDVDYCEAHHLIPLGRLSEATRTSLDDLAIVCANCHRVIHLFDPPLTMAQMRDRLRGQRLHRPN